MAWFDNALDKETVIKQKSNAVFKTHYIKQLLEKLASSKLGLFLTAPIRSMQRQLVQRKLTILEKKISLNNWKNTANVLNLLRQFAVIKKSLKDQPIAKLNLVILARLEQLKRQLINQSYQRYLPKEQLKNPLAFQSSHQKLLTSLTSTALQRPTFKQALSGGFYWQHTAKDSVVAASSNFAKKPSKIYLQLTFKKFLEVLKCKLDLKFVEHSQDMVLSHEKEICKASFGQNHMVASIGLKLTAYNSSRNYTSSFWDSSRPPTLLKDLPVFLANKKLMEEINEIFFLTSDHFNKFKDMLKQNKEPEPLALMDILENNQLIKIQLSEISLPSMVR